jgi:hypothetical protein
VRLIALLREIEGGCAFMFALGLPSGRLAGMVLVKPFCLHRLLDKQLARICDGDQ